MRHLFVAGLLLSNVALAGAPEGKPAVPVAKLPDGGVPELREWAVAKVTLTSGLTVVVNFRRAVAPVVNRPNFQWRAMVTCPYENRGDNTGLPGPDTLKLIQDLENTLSRDVGGVIRLMSKTGEGKRETVFQVHDKKDFEAALSNESRASHLDCTVTFEQDPRWQFWADTVKKLNAAPPPPATQP